MTDELSREYEDYVEWKGWSAGFVCSPEDAAYYSAELSRDLAGRQHMVEIGFGSGALLAWARAQGKQVAGVEAIAELVTAGRRAGYDVHDVRECPLSRWADQVDAFVSFDVSEHLTRQQIVEQLIEMHAALKPNGVAIFRFPNCQSPFGLAFQFGDATHLTMLSVPIFSNLVAAANKAIRAQSSEPGLEIIDARDQTPRRTGGVVRGLAKNVVSALGRQLFWLLSTPYRHEDMDKIRYGANVIVVLRKPSR